MSATHNHDSSHDAEHDEHDSAQVHAHDDDHGGGHDEPWLVSYADMMTLLFGFFVIMYSFAAAKNSGEETDLFKIKKEIATYFGGEYVNPIESVAKDLKNQISGSSLGHEVTFTIVGDSLELVIQSKVLFTSGSAEFITDQLPIIESLLDVLIQWQMKEYQVIIEGHTDDAPISTEKYRSNWDLSAARASTVAMLLEKKKYDPTRLSIQAFGDHRPLVPNRDTNGKPIELNMAKNRRIVIRLVGAKTTPPANARNNQPAANPANNQTEKKE